MQLTYNIASREVAYGVLSSQRDGAQHDEDQYEVGKDLMVDQLMAEHTKPTEKMDRGWMREQKDNQPSPLLFFIYSYTKPVEHVLSPNLYWTHGLVLLKMKKALPSGMGGVFSLMVSSYSLCGRGPDGTSGWSSLS